MTASSAAAPCWVELSGENLPLARLELISVATVLDAEAEVSGPLPWGERFVEVVFSRAGPVLFLAPRLAFAKRVVQPLAEGTVDLLSEAMVLQGALGAPARVRVSSEGRSALHRDLPKVLGHAYVQGGGRIDLDSPTRDFVALLPPAPASPPSATEGAVGEVIAEAPRSETESRRSKHQAFRKPVTLPPKLARCLVNAAKVPLGGKVLDPFCGTGAILREALLLGYRAYGGDADAEMVRGALQNLRGEESAPDALVQRDVREAGAAFGSYGPFDGAVFDPPYGRASSTGGADPGELLSCALASVGPLLRPGGRVALLVPDPELLREVPPGFVREELLQAERVHGSLTRWLAVLRRVEGPARHPSG